MKTQPGDIIEIKINGKSYRTVIDENGVQRFATSGAADVVDFLFNNGRLDLNQLAVDYHQGKFSLESYMEFYMLLGYSVSGMCGLSWMEDQEVSNPLWE